MEVVGALDDASVVGALDGASVGSMVGALKAVGGACDGGFVGWLQGAYSEALRGVAPNPALVVPAFGATSAVVAAGATSGSFFRVVAFVFPHSFAQ